MSWIGFEVGSIEPIFAFLSGSNLVIVLAFSCLETDR